MLQIDYAAFLIAGIVGAFCGYDIPNRRWIGSAAWAIVAVWALLKLLKVL